MTSREERLHPGTPGPSGVPRSVLGCWSMTGRALAVAGALWGLGLAQAAELPVRAGLAVLPGTGYESTKDRWLGRCVTGDVVQEGTGALQDHMGAPLDPATLEAALGVQRDVS